MARDSKMLSGWKGNSTDWCQDLKVGETVEECIEEHTFTRTSVLKDVIWGKNSQNSILDDNLIAEDFTIAWQGKFFSVETQRRMVADDDGAIPQLNNGTRLSLALAFGLTFEIFIYDPDFFEINYKPIFPGVLKTINPERDFNHVYNLALTEVSDLNTERN